MNDAVFALKGVNISALEGGSQQILELATFG